MENPINSNLYSLTDHNLLIRMNEKVDSIEKQTENFDKRINKLENWRSYIAGGVAVLIFIVGLVATKI